MSTPPIPRVNEHNEIIGETTIIEAVENNWPRRVVRVFVFDESQRVLLQKRSARIIGFPNLWDQSAGGHVDVGESEYEAAVRETKEEIGVEVELEPIVLGYHFDFPIDPQFGYLYRTILPGDTEFAFDDKDVSELKWLTVSELEEWMEESGHDFVPAFRHIWKLMRDRIIA